MHPGCISGQMAASIFTFSFRMTVTSQENQDGSSVVMCSYRTGCWEFICLSHCNTAETVTSSECHRYLEHCLSYFSTVMNKHHAQGNLKKKKAFNWESWFQRVVEFMTIMGGSMVTGGQEQQLRAYIPVCRQRTQRETGPGISFCNLNPLLVTHLLQQSYSF